MRALGAVLLLLALCAVPAADAGRFHLRGTVTRVVDGDTVDVRLRSGRAERVRLIGIDTPEAGSCGAADATARVRTLALRRPVVLQGDATQATRDRYGRLLAYVWVGGRRDVGLDLLRRGLARVYVYDRPFARLGVYRRAAAPLSCPKQAPLACDPAYPDVCIPSPPPDLDCADVEHTRFVVLAPDPHRFDGDRDGIGCEG